MNLTASDLATVLAILEKIDSGIAAPEMPDRLGRFFRQYRTGRSELDSVLARCGVGRRSDAAISGRTLDPIELHPLLEATVSPLGFPLGEVAETVAISDQLGALVRVTMWLKSPTANASYNLLQSSGALSLAGDYRWTPPARVTLGESRSDGLVSPLRWHEARCLKAVADDLARPPHALEYMVDYRLGPPGLKWFRSICAVKRTRGWDVLPALGEFQPLEIARILPGVRQVATDCVALLQIYREPWSSGWTIAEAVEGDACTAMAHAITWADFHCELHDTPLDGTVIEGIRRVMGANGLRAATLGEPNVTRTLLPLAREVVRWLRGVA